MRRLFTLLLTALLSVTCLLPTAFAAEKSKIVNQKRTEEEARLDFKVEAMLEWALAIAADDSHGYSQAYRYGPNYDCTSFVSTALMKGGFGLDEYLSTIGLVQNAENFGFTVYRRGEVVPQRGDILVQWNVHTEICMGDGGCVAAHQDYDGYSGDRTGHEIEYRPGGSDYGCPFCKYEQYNYILRYEPPVCPVYLGEEDYQSPGF